MANNDRSRELIPFNIYGHRNQHLIFNHRLRRKNNSHSKNKWAILITILCLIVLCITAGSLIIEYFAYETTTHSDIALATSVLLPSLTWCIKYQIKNEDVKEKYPGIYWRVSNLNNLEIINDTDWNRYLTANQINNLTLSIDEIIQTCEVLYPWTLSYNHCTGISRIQLHLDNSRKCFTLFSRSMTPIRYMREDLYRNFLVQMNLNYRSNIGIYFHHRDEPIDTLRGLPSFMIFTQGLLMGAYFTWDTTIVTKLQAPYDTNCFNYSLLPCKARNTCIKQCVARTYLEKNKKWPATLGVLVGSNDGNNLFDSEKSLNEYYKNCSAIYKQPECSEVIYRMYTKRNIIDSDHNESRRLINRTFYFRVYLSQAQERNLKYVPIRTIDLFIGYLMSMIQFITGLSSFGVLNYSLINSEIFLVKNFAKWLYSRLTVRTYSDYKKLAANLKNHLRRSVISLQPLFFMSCLYMIIMQWLTFQNSYFMYYTKTMVLEVVGNDQLLPTFSICFNYDEVTYGKNVGTIIKSAGNHTDFVKSCELLLNSTKVRCEDITTPLVHLQDFWKCFVYFHEIKLKYNFKRITGKELLNFKLNLTAVNTEFSLFTIQDSSAHYLDSPEYPGTLELDPSLIRKLTLTFDRLVNILLPAPYETKCINYDKEYKHCFSDIDCVELCTQNEFVRKFNLLPDNLIVNFKENINNLTFPFRNQEYRKLYDNLTNNSYIHDDYRVDRIKIRHSCGLR